MALLISKFLLTHEKCKNFSPWSIKPERLEPRWSECIKHLVRVTPAYRRVTEIDTTSMFSNHRAPSLFILIIRSESEPVFDQTPALHRGTDRKRQAVQRRGQTQPCIYPCISISLMIIHVQSLYNSSEEAKCWAKAFIIEDLSEHYCFCCMKQRLQAIIMITIICWETCSTQIGSMSVIMRCTRFLRGLREVFTLLLKQAKVTDADF